MTTVGYGDFFPLTHCGRMISTITAFWGVLLLSLIVVALNNIFEFDASEIKAFMLLKRLSTKDMLKKQSMEFIQSRIKIARLMKPNRFWKEGQPKKVIDYEAVKMSQRDCKKAK
jgi:hypothetical protein